MNTIFKITLWEATHNCWCYYIKNTQISTILNRVLKKDHSPIYIKSDYSKLLYMLHIYTLSNGITWGVVTTAYDYMNVAVISIPKVNVYMGWNKLGWCKFN